MSFQLVISRSGVPLFLAALLVFCILRVLLNELNWEERERWWPGLSPLSLSDGAGRFSIFSGDNLLAFGIRIGGSWAGPWGGGLSGELSWVER